MDGRKIIIGQRNARVGDRGTGQGIARDSNEYIARNIREAIGPEMVRAARMVSIATQRHATMTRR